MNANQVTSVNVNQLFNVEFDVHKVVTQEYGVVGFNDMSFWRNTYISEECVASIFRYDG
jgi:hypothetical protein